MKNPNEETAENQAENTTAAGDQENNDQVNTNFDEHQAIDEEGNELDPEDIK